MSLDHMNAHLHRDGSIGYESPHRDPDADSCPPHHERFGSIEQCPWCDSYRCPKNMGNHIEIRHAAPESVGLTDRAEGGG